MDEMCGEEVTHIDEKGYIYCTNHGWARRSWCRCRKLRPHELSRLRRGLQVQRY
jgi:hypothetical protein